MDTRTYTISRKDLDTTNNLNLFNYLVESKLTTWAIYIWVNGIHTYIPTKTKKIKELYDEVRTTEDEFKAIGYYSGTKIDNTRALILYAKILSTKLQYMAAKDLLIIEARRRGRAEDVDTENFDLGKYKLTDSYVKAIEEESNKGIDIHAGVETK